MSLLLTAAMLLAVPECPVPYTTGFSNTWGAPRSEGRQHLGTDMFADYPTFIVAPEPGRVRFGTARLGGNVVRLTADTGRYYYFAHLLAVPDLHLTQGERVLAGRVIGFIGSSGNANQPHLHIEVHIDGQPANPYWWLDDAC